MTLTEFLFARISEDELSARQTPDEGVDLDDPSWTGGIYTWVSPQSGSYGIGVSSERLLAECEAKRRIVARCTLVREAFHDKAMWNVARREKSHAYATLCDLATPYADHPDYDEEWSV